MASTVPYSGVPDVVPRLEPTPSVNVPTPPAAFGVNIAQQLEHLGQVQEGAGKELFDRAYAMRELQAHANANAAIADTSRQQLLAGTDYQQLQGKAAVDGLKPHMENLEKIRESGGQGLSPYERLLYDNESRTSTFREQFSASRYAGAQQKDYIVGASKAAVETAVNSVAIDPTNEATYRDGLAKIRAEANHQADVGGLPVGDPQRDLLVKTDVSRAIERRITGLADLGKVKDAQDLFNKATGEKDLVSTGTDAYGRTSTQRIQQYINDKRNTIGARHGASEVLGGDYPGWTGGKLNDSGILAALRSSEGGSYAFRGPTVTDKSGNTGQALGHYGVMSYSLQGFLRQAGMDPMTEGEFLASPAAQDKLAVAMMRQYQERFGSAQLAAIAWFAGPGTAQAVADGKMSLASIRDRNMNAVTYLHNFNAGVVGNASLKDKTDMGRQWAREQGFDDEGTDYVVANIERLNAQDERVKRDTEFNNLQTIDTALMTGDQAGKIPTSVEELTADPKVKDAWDGLQPRDQLKIMNVLMKNAKGDVAMTPDRFNKFNDLLGTAIQDPEKFMELTQHPGNLDFPLSAKRKITDERLRIYRNQEADPKIGYALRLVADQLESVGFVRGKDEDGRNKVTGALMDAMRSYEEMHDKPMGDEEIKAATSRLIQQHGTSFVGIPTGSAYAIEDAVPENEADRIRNWQGWGGRMPTDLEVSRMYWSMQALQAAEQYQKLYGKPTPEGGQEFKVRPGKIQIISGAQAKETQ